MLISNSIFITKTATNFIKVNDLSIGEDMTIAFWIKLTEQKENANIVTCYF
jgi:hypothetical protein